MKTVLIMTVIVFWIIVGLIFSSVGYIVNVGSLGSVPDSTSAFDLTFLWNLATFQIEGLGTISSFLLVFNIATVLFLIMLLRGD